MKIKVSTIAEKVIGRVIGAKGDHFVSVISVDSRSMVNPPDTVFFALQGEHQDGHRFVMALIERGVKTFVVDHVEDGWLQHSEVSFIKVENTVKALQSLAAYKRSIFQGKVVAITGSNGKTIVKEWMSHLLSKEFKLSRSPKSYNSQVGVPLSLWMSDPESDFYFIEAGISLPGEMSVLNKIVQPSIAVITNIGPAHQENFQSYAQKAEEKLQIAKGTGTLVYSADDKYLAEAVNKNKGLDAIRQISWSLNGQGHINAKIKLQQSSRSILSVHLESSHFEIEIPFSDKASIENCLSCICTLLALGLNPESFKTHFLDLEPVAMRLELKKGRGKSIVINDAYNSDLGSLAIALDFLNQQGVDQSLRHTVILSDIQQSGEQSGELYSKVNSLLSDKNVDRLIGVGHAICQHRDLFTIQADFFESTAELLAAMKPWDFEDEAILIKGARKFEFEKVSAKLENKVHRTTLEINLTALISNYNYFRSLLHKETKIMAMVKAFAYGSGAYEVARLLQYHGVDYLAVAVADEGVELREAGITIPIVVMTPEPESFDVMLDYALEPEIYSMDELFAFEQKISAVGLNEYPVHLKLDTGMHRLGFMRSELFQVIDFFQSHATLKMASVFSHLAGSDEITLDSFTEQQVADFKDMVGRIQQSLGHKLQRHILNSAGCQRFPQHQMEMVRLGIGMYGVSAVQDVELEHVSSLKTRIAQIKSLSANETVGYGRKGVLSKQSKIAILPIGYADGLNRKLGNGKGYVVINGAKAAYVGNICMDLCMVDVTGINANVGDEVIVFGKELPITKLAGWLNTIPYEIITSISTRVKRVFLRE